MKRGLLLAVTWAVGLILIAGCGHKETAKDEEHSHADQKKEGEIHLTKDRQTRAGIVAVAPEAKESKPEIKALGRVLDPAPLAALTTEMDAAHFALTTSTKEFERLKTLGENTSARARETAEGTMAKDRAALAGVQTQLLSTWGKTLALHTNLPTLVHSLLTQEAALVRIDAFAGSDLPATPSEIRIVPVTGEPKSSKAELLGPAPNVDPQSQGPALFVLAKERRWPPGTAVVAWLAIDGTNRNGFLLPRSAVVQNDSDTFVFVQTGEETFERRRVVVGESDRDRIFIASGLKAGEPVVTTGAQQLLSEELKGTSAPE